MKTVNLNEYKKIKEKRNQLKRQYETYQGHYEDYLNHVLNDIFNEYFKRLERIRIENELFSRYDTKTLNEMQKYPFYYANVQEIINELSDDDPNDLLICLTKGIKASQLLNLLNLVP